MVIKTATGRLAKTLATVVTQGGLAALLGACAVTTLPVAQAMQIDGLGPLQPAAGAIAAVGAQEGNLRLALADGRTIVIRGWPAYLPQQFGPQRLSGARQLHPAGPSDRLEFSHPGESTPWLVVLSGARVHTPIAGGWQLLRREAGWMLGDGRTVQHLPVPGQAALMQMAGDSWCVYLLETAGEAPAQPGVAEEGEPQTAVVALRGGGHCSTAVR